MKKNIPIQHMSPPCVFIIILQYNNPQDTIRCLNSVKELGYTNYDVIIVDNGSGVNPVKSRKAGAPKELFDGVKYVSTIEDRVENEGNSNSYTKYKILSTKYNLGYSGGNNVGIKYALERGADYIFILNPDTTIEKNILTKLIETAESDPQIGILGPAIDEGDKTTYGGKIEWLKPELSHLVVEPLSILSGSTTKYYIPGAAMLIKKAVVEKNGLLDECYFLYFEDADYCLRAQKAGYKLAIVPETTVYHRPSSSTKTLGAPLLLHYHYRNAHLFNWKNGPLWVKFALPFWSFFIIIRQLIKIVFASPKREISKAILAGVLDFYRNHFGKINAQDRY